MAKQSKGVGASVEEIVAFLKKNPAARKEVAKMIARDHPKDYLAHVKVDSQKLTDVSARFLSSDKEWQE